MRTLVRRGEFFSAESDRGQLQLCRNVLFQASCDLLLGNDGAGMRGPDRQSNRRQGRTRQTQQGPPQQQQ